MQLCSAPATTWLAGVAALLAAACPAEVRTIDELPFACQRVEDCALGYGCEQGLCVRVGAAADDVRPLDAATRDSGGRVDAGALDTNLTDTARLDSLAQDSTFIDAAGADGAAADATAAEAGAPDAPIADACAADLATPDLAPADTTLPDLALADVAIPDSAAPDTAAPDAATPDTATPDTAVPDTAVADAGCQRPGPWFDGLDDRVVIPAAGDLGSATRFTVEAWILPLAEDLSPGVEAVIVSQHDPGGRDGYELRLRDGWLELIVDDGSLARPYSAWAAYRDEQRLRPGRWAHVAGVLDRATDSWLYLFVDGVLQRAESEPALAVSGSAGALHIGAPAARSCCHFAGIIDQVRVSSSARYTIGFSVPLTALDVDIDTVGLWPLDESSGQQVFDRAATPHHGTLGVDAQAAADDPLRGPVTCVAERPGATLGDAGSVDAGPEAGIALPTCDTTYGAASGYLLCEQSASTCEFAVNTGGSNCATLCTSLGGACLDAFDNIAGCERRAFMGDTCQTNRGSEICVCTRE